MIKVITIIFCIATFISCKNYSSISDAIATCTATYHLSDCYYNNPQNINGFPTLPDCALDLAKSNLCLANYGCLFNSNNAAKEFPYVCLLCITKSPTKSDLYKSYQNCMANAGEFKLISFIIAMVMLIMLLI